MLTVSGISASYGTSQVLFDVDLHISPGEVVSLIGRNGMGKTSLIRSLLSMQPIRCTRGSIRFEDEVVSGWPTHKIARLGIGLVPEGRQIFSLLSVEENLLATALLHNNQWTLERIYALFPRLAERRKQGASTLSGGEQQMLAIGRALMTGPKLLLLDEATEGLAPLVREQIWKTIEKLRENALSILVVDQSVEKLMQIADRNYVIEKGRIVDDVSSAALQADASRVQRYLHL